MTIYPTALGRTTMPAKKPAAPKAAPTPKYTDMQLAQQQIDPLIKAITDRVNSRSQAAQQAVTGYGNSLASYLAGVNYGSPYQQAIPQQAATDAALQQSLTGKGNELAQGLASRLASIQESHAVDPAVQAVQQYGAGTGNTQLAYGSANIGNLLAEQAAANEYGLKQPGIAKTATLQGIGKVGAQAVNDIADQTGALTGKIPDIVAGIQTNRARQQQIDLENRLANKKFGLDVAKTNASIAQGNKRLTIEQQNTQIRKAVEQANISLRGQSNAIAQQNANTSSYRAQIAAQTAAASAAKKAHPQLTPGQVAGIAAKAAKDAEDLYHGSSRTNAQGQTIVESYTQTYQDAIKTLTNRYPTLGRSGVMKLVNSWYKPGEYGRPKAKAKPLSPAQQSATNAALNPVATLTGGR